MREECYKEYITTLCSVLPVLCQRYDTRFTALLDYQGKQRAQDEMVNIFINGGKKYTSRQQKRRKHYWLHATPWHEKWNDPHRRHSSHSIVNISLQ